MTEETKLRETLRGGLWNGLKGCYQGDPRKNVWTLDATLTEVDYIKNRLPMYQWIGVFSCVPILYPFDLTKPIKIDGEEFVPIEEFKKIAEQSKLPYAGPLHSVLDVQTIGFHWQTELMDKWHINWRGLENFVDANEVNCY